MHIYDKQCEIIQKKISGRTQTSRFSVFIRGRQELCAENAEIWFVQREIQTDFSQEILMHNTSSSSVPDQVSSWAAAARWRGGEGCSLPVAHQIGRSTILNISGNSWGLPIHLLRVVWIFLMNWCRRFAPPSWDRLDRPHCISNGCKKGLFWLFGLFETEDWGRVELGYPKLATLVLDDQTTDVMWIWNIHIRWL